MGKNNNIIEINGKRYNATTGVPVAQTAPQKPAGRSVNGIVAPDQPAILKASASEAKNSSGHASHPKTSHGKDVAHHPATHAAAHPPQPSKILMRSAVSKPAPGSQRHIKAQGHTGTLVRQPSVLLQIKPSVLALDSKRLQHARRVAKSKIITHFNLDPATPAQLSAANVEAPTVTTVPVARPAHPQTTADLLERALAAAHSHEQASPKSKTHKRAGPKKHVTAAALAIAVIGLGVFSVVQNMNLIRVHVASATAGFGASLPSNQPSGYTLNHVGSSPGVVAMNFQSTSDTRHYSLTEKSSAWDSEALRDNFVSLQGPNYQTVESGGRTIYLYGQNNATWVNNGIWYQVVSDGSLNYHQLVQLATSL